TAHHALASHVPIASAHAGPNVVATMPMAPPLSRRAQRAHAARLTQKRQRHPPTVATAAPPRPLPANVIAARKSPPHAPAAAVVAAHASGTTATVRPARSTRKVTRCKPRPPAPTPPRRQPPAPQMQPLRTPFPRP